MSLSDILLPLLMFVGAALYTSVGHGGASAYIALMALFGVAAPVMRPTALVLNVFATVFTSFRFARAGLFDWRNLWPFLVGSIPFAFVGGGIQLPGHFYRPLVGAVLLIAAARLLWKGQFHSAATAPGNVPVWAGVGIGAGIGFLSGLTGTGGGIFLSPVLLFFGWAQPRIASGIAAAFILCNSLSGLLGNVASVQSLPAELPVYVVAVLLGALVGTTLGIGKLATTGVMRALGLVLVIAGLKLIGVY